MGTCSNIGVQLEDGTIKAVYCNFDSQLTSNGDTLLSYYDSREKALQILEKGDMSYLSDTIEKTEYYVDRGEEMIKPRVFQSVKDYTDMDYNYFFSLEGKWMVCCLRYNNEPKLLDEAVGDAIERECEISRSRRNRR